MIILIYKRNSRLRSFAETPDARSCQIEQAHLPRLSLTEFYRNTWRSVIETRASSVSATLAYGVLKQKPVFPTLGYVSQRIPHGLTKVRDSLAIASVKTGPTTARRNVPAWNKSLSAGLSNAQTI